MRRTHRHSHRNDRQRFAVGRAPDAPSSTRSTTCSRNSSVAFCCSMNTRLPAPNSATTNRRSVSVARRPESPLGDGNLARITRRTPAVAGGAVASAQRRPKYPAMNKTITTRPTSQMIRFTMLSSDRTGLRTSQDEGQASILSRGPSIRALGSLASKRSAVCGVAARPPRRHLEGGWQSF